MSNFQTLIDLENAGFLVELVKKGIVPGTYIMYVEIYKDVQNQLKQDGCEKMVAYQNVAEKYKISINTVRLAVRWCMM